MKVSLVFSLLVLGTANCLANTILLPAGTLTVSAASTIGASFTYAGTLTQNDTLEFTESNFACLQSGSRYCTNGAGVVTVTGSSGVGATSAFSGVFNGTSATWNFGALLVEISGEGTKQIFSTNAAAGLGSSNPPASLTLPSTTLSSLGFGSFSITDPTITFIVADDYYPDNSGTFTLSQSSITPEPSTGLIAAVGALILLLRRVRQIAG